MPDPLTIRRATPADAAALADLALRTFMDTFQDGSDPHDLALHTARAYGLAQQTAEIAHPRIVTLVAEEEGRLPGYAQLRRGTPPACVDLPEAVEISRFYLDRPWHGRGLAQRMMEAALDAARALGGPAVWLTVYEHNHRAMAFYHKAGFRMIGRHGFLFGATREDDYVMFRSVDTPGTRG